MPGWALVLLAVIGGSVLVGFGASLLGADPTQTGQAVGVYLAGWAIVGLPRLWRWAWRPLRQAPAQAPRTEAGPVRAQASAVTWIFAGAAIALVGVVGGRALIAALAGVVWDWFGPGPLPDTLYAIGENNGLAVIGALVALFGLHRVVMLRLTPQEKTPPE